MAGSTNFVQHNPTEANQQPDFTFDADSLTTGGIGTDAIMPSDWMNKRWYQDSTFVAAFAQMMANKGYAMSDSNIGTLVSILSAVVTDSDLKPNMVAVNYSPTPTFNGALANGFSIDISSGNVTSSTAVNCAFYQVYTFQIYNPTNHSFAWPANFIGAYAPNNAAILAQNVQQFVLLPDNNFYSVTSMLDAIVAGKQNNLGFTPVQQGTGVSQLGNAIKIGWDSNNRLRATVDTTDLGEFVFDSELNAQFVKGQFTTTGGTLGNNQTTTYDTGIAVSGTDVVSASVVSGVLNFTIIYDVTTVGGTIKVNIRNASSSTQSYAAVTYNYCIIK